MPAAALERGARRLRRGTVRALRASGDSRRRRSGLAARRVAAAIGLGAALAYLRCAGSQADPDRAGACALLFLGLFLLHSDASRLSFSGADTALAAGEQAKAPVILVAFDELPINSLRDSHGRIDRVRFPNFAALAAGSTWFSNTSTVAEGTTHAVPAILTGRFPRAGEFPGLHRPPPEPVHAPRRRGRPARARPGDAPLPAQALPRARRVVQRQDARPRAGHGDRLPAPAAPGLRSPAGSLRSPTAGTTSCRTRASTRTREPFRRSFCVRFGPARAPRSGTCTSCSRTAPGGTCPPAGATRSGRRPAGAATRSGTPTRRRSTSTGSGTCSSSATPTACSGG